MSQAKITYVNGRGRAEVVRYVLSAVGIAFTEDFVEDADQFEDLRNSGKLILRQLPLLEIDGFVITQTEAMIRYIARNYNFYGSTEEDRIRCDMIYDGLKDAAIGVGGIGMEFQIGEEKELRKEGMKQRMDKYFPMFEKMLSGKQYFLGETLSFVDVVFLHDLEWLVDIFGENVLDSYPEIKALQSRLQNLPNIKSYLSSEQKKSYPNADYIALVKNVFHGKPSKK
mmetsp:Transcript_29268/g.50061  ORF Transcript_29268/g.50061 Transcript_29268/m.50061 type:complete len:226 (+) Transcript_29268:38-715(+)